MKLDAVSGRQITRSFKQHPSASLTAALFLFTEILHHFGTRHVKTRGCGPSGSNAAPSRPSHIDMAVAIWFKDGDHFGLVTFFQPQPKCVLENGFPNNDNSNKSCGLRKKIYQLPPTPSVCHLIFTNLCPPKKSPWHRTKVLPFIWKTWRIVKFVMSVFHPWSFKVQRVQTETSPLKIPWSSVHREPPRCGKPKVARGKRERVERCNGQISWSIFMQCTNIYMPLCLQCVWFMRSYSVLSKYSALLNYGNMIQPCMPASGKWGNIWH